MPTPDPILFHPLFIAGALTFALLAGLSVFIGRQFSLAIFFVALPFISLPLISGRIGGIPGLSIPNIELLLALILAFWAWQLTVPIHAATKRYFLLYLGVTLLAIVIRTLNYDEIRIMDIYAKQDAFGFLRSFVTQTALIAIIFLFVAKYCAGTNNGYMLITRVWALAVVVFGTTILVMTAYYFGLYRNHNVVRELVQKTIGLHSNEYVILYAISAPLFFSALTMQAFSRRDKILFMIALGVSLVATLFSYSRSGYVVMALVVAIYAFMQNRRLLWLVLPAAVMIGVLMPETVIERSTTGFVDNEFTGKAGLSSFMAGRNLMWIYTIEHIYRGPVTLLFGGGRYSFIPLAYRQFGVAMPHNGYLELILDSGIVGFTIVVGFFVYLISYFRQVMLRGSNANRPLYFAALVGLCMFMIICLSGPPFYPAIAHAPIWLLVGIAGGVRQRELRNLDTSAPFPQSTARVRAGFASPSTTRSRLQAGPAPAPKLPGRGAR